MRPLPDTLKELQRRSANKPVVQLEVATYGHPAAVADSELQWENFAWERLTSPSDATIPCPHASAVAGDGSLIRIRNYNGSIYVQRVVAPGPTSNWGAWSGVGYSAAGYPVAIVARGAEVIAFFSDGTSLFRMQSSNYGATWAGQVAMLNARPCERGVAAAYKSNGDLFVVHASDMNDPTSLYIQKRIGGSWSTGLGQISGDYPISALAMYYEGDWNMLSLLLDGSYIRLARAIYGDGDRYPVGTFSGWEFINSYKAKVDFSTQVALRQFRTRRGAQEGSKTPTYYEKVSAVNEQRAVDNLGVDDPFITYHASSGTVFSFAKDNRPWFYRLRPFTEFQDMDWYRAYPLDTIATYGLSLCCDGTYLYACAPNQVWRSLLPGNWTPPVPGSGAGTGYSVPSSQVLAVREKVESLAASSLEVVLDNSKGQYNSAGTGSASLLASLKRGSQVSLSIGYRRKGEVLTSLAGRYFIESLGYKRGEGEASFIIRCTDAWGLLERFAFSRPVEWNSGGDVYTVYDLIGIVLQAVGGSLSYVSRSTEITSIYPYVDVHAGQNGAQVLRRLLELVPDVIYFVGLQGYIVYPQSTDPYTYMFRFPQ